jgi:uncharacterized heparinase superfamily protein
MLTAASLLKALEADDFSRLWRRLASRPFPAITDPVELAEYETHCAGDGRRILDAADEALLHRVTLLGSGPIELGKSIDWHKDYKVGRRWTPQYSRSMSYYDHDQPSDVKIPWELSRLQWLVPVGQAYLLTGDERYAREVRAVLEQWMDENPYCWGINWRIAMEPAMRIFIWTWFFHVFGASEAWSDRTFRESFVRMVFLHGDYVHRYLEHSDVNGNHCVADAAALVWVGLFFGSGRLPGTWLDRGLAILHEELPRQVTPDGVDFEGSVPYHRLVLELFLMPALYLEQCGLSIPDFYRERVASMARFVSAYSRCDGSVPLLGDADDGRVLPLGGQPLNDHRYLCGLIGQAWDVPELKQAFGGQASEIFWLLGPAAVRELEATPRAGGSDSSIAFTYAGHFVMRGERDHVFIDCGPVGMRGRGGHGHNDCLSFEAVLDGVHLVTDCGSFVYTASAAERNAFRSTAYHNTPRVDGEEINRFVSPRYLWSLHNDAIPHIRRWVVGRDADVLVAAHSGFQRLARPVAPVRTFVLDKNNHKLVVRDDFEGGDAHAAEVPLHLAPGVEVVGAGRGQAQLRAGSELFALEWLEAEHWALRVGRGRFSPSYGVYVPIVRLAFRANSLSTLTLLIGRPQTADLHFRVSQLLGGMSA